jgi:hypothetical protein
LVEQELIAIREMNPGNPYAQSLSQIRQEVSGMDAEELKGYLEGAAGLAGFGTLLPAAPSIAERIARTAASVGARVAPALKKVASNKFVQMMPGIGTAATLYNVGTAAYDAYNRFAKSSNAPSAPVSNVPSAPVRLNIPATNVPSWADLFRMIFRSQGKFLLQGAICRC